MRGPVESTTRVPGVAGRDVLGWLGLLQSAETIGRLILGLGGLTTFTTLMRLGLETLRCWNVAVTSAAPV